MRLNIPDYGTRFDSLSLSACFLDLIGVGEKKRQATGFFWRRSEKVFLVTNWHVVTGLNIITGRSMQNGWSPEALKVEYFLKPAKEHGAANNWLTANVPSIEVPLYQEFHRPFWLQHVNTFNWSVDIVAIDVTAKLSEPSRISCINDSIYPRLFHFVGSDIFVLGHPLPKARNAYPVSFPIWKRGSIASEIFVPWNMRPAFLIDSRTSEGMSGSPVFSRVFGPAAYADGTIKADNILVSEFMGIYSGRLFDDENNASIGLVWHRNLIDEIISNGVAGNRDWSPSPLDTAFSGLKPDVVYTSETR